MTNNLVGQDQFIATSMKIQIIYRIEKDNIGSGHELAKNLALEAGANLGAKGDQQQDRYIK